MQGVAVCHVLSAHTRSRCSAYAGTKTEGSRKLP